MFILNSVNLIFFFLIKLIALINSLFEPLSDKKAIFNSFISFEKQASYSFRKLEEKLISMGYQRVYQVENMGEFAIRGDIIDIYSISELYPIRLEFFDEQLESIRFFDLLSQLH